MAIHGQPMRRFGLAAALLVLGLSCADQAPGERTPDFVVRRWSFVGDQSAYCQRSADLISCFCDPVPDVFEGTLTLELKDPITGRIAWTGGEKAIQHAVLSSTAFRVMTDTLWATTENWDLNGLTDVDTLKGTFTYKPHQGPCRSYGGRFIARPE